MCLNIIHFAMRKTISLTLLFLLFTFGSFSQESLNAKVKVSYGLTSKKLRDIMRIQNIEYQNIKIKCKELKQKDFYVLTKSFWYNDSLKQTDIVIDTLYSSKQNEKYFGTKGLSGKTLHLRLLTQITEGDFINVQFHTNRMTKPLKYAKLQYDNYSLRDISEFIKSSNDRIPFTVMTLPWKDKERPGMLLYCELDAKAKSIDKWGELYGIEHYILFEVVIE